MCRSSGLEAAHTDSPLSPLPSRRCPHPMLLRLRGEMPPPLFRLVLQLNQVIPPYDNHRLGGSGTKTV